MGLLEHCFDNIVDSIVGVFGRAGLLPGDNPSIGVGRSGEIEDYSIRVCSELTVSYVSVERHPVTQNYPPTSTPILKRVDLVILVNDCLPARWRREA